MRTSIKKYQNSFAESVVDADPHTLISIIFKHILINVAIAKGAISRKEIENKGKALIKSMALVGELQDSIDNVINMMISFLILITTMHFRS